ncbi:hypothetical protein DL96DRAFT_1618097 [Flagelloscypha sp. PMI_526]|nr:hypothetical protein DL96DRAFT_1618097 [Flagelloscypha sp. PMI_526]
MLFILFLCLMSPVSCAPLNGLQSPNTPLAVGTKQHNAWLNLHWTFGGSIASGSVTVVDRNPMVSFDARPAAFGPEMVVPILGYLIPLSSFTYTCDDPHASSDSTDPNAGCPNLCVYPDAHTTDANSTTDLSKTGAPDPTESWFALVQRGTCDFANKAREAQRLGAQGIVVGNYQTIGGGDGLVSMYSPGDSSDVKIPATFVSHSSYETLLDLIGKSNTTKNGLQTISVLLEGEYGSWEWYSPLLTFLSILLLPTIITFITLLIHRIRLSRAEARERCPEDILHKLAWSIWPAGGLTGNSQLEKRFDEPPSPPQPLQSRPRTPTDAGEEEAEPLLSPPSLSNPEASASTSHPTPAEEIPWYNTQTECAICLSEFAPGDHIRILPCHHIFHLKEVDEWLVKVRKVCPICKCDVTQPFMDNKPSSSDTELTNTESEPQTVDAEENEPADEETPLLGFWRVRR